MRHSIPAARAACAARPTGRNRARAIAVAVLATLWLPIATRAEPLHEATTGLEQTDPAAAAVEAAPADQAETGDGRAAPPRAQPSRPSAKPNPAPKQTNRPTGPRIDVEATYYRQPALVQDALARLAPQRPGATDVYFVGFASFADQDVFRSEAGGARQVVESAFDAAGRAVMLVNHPDTVKDVPLANGHNLEAVLEGVGRVMDREEDVLFLFLTSHGDKGRLAVVFNRFSQNHLTPDRLAAALKRSGIKNKVVVISACHSGSFVKALEDEGTLVITAAHADRSSFGCSSERAWTYFGDAFFNRALRETTSLLDAFERARGTVTRWEKEQGFKPSEPQISIGARITDKLAEIEVRKAAEAPLR